MKNTLEGINSRKNEAEEWRSHLEERMVEIATMEQNKENKLKLNENSLRYPWDSLKHTNIHVIGVLEREQREDKGK